MKTIVKHLWNYCAHLPIVAVEIGPSFLKIVQLEKHDRDIILKHVAMVPLDNHEPADLLRKTLKQSGVSAKYAALAVASPEVIAKPFQFPKMSRKELAGAVTLEAEHAILNGHTMDEMAVDWHTLEQSSAEGTRGVLAVVPKTFLHAQIEILKNAGLRPVIADVEGLALWNAYWTLIGSAENNEITKTVLLINVGSQQTTLVVGQNSDELVLIRTMSLGCDKISEGRKIEWLEEIRDSLIYARSKKGAFNLDAAYLTGEGVTDALAVSLQSALMTPVQPWNPLKQLPFEGITREQAESVGPYLTAVIGLAMRQTL